MVFIDKLKTRADIRICGGWVGGWAGGWVCLQIVARDKYLTLMSGGLITELPLFEKEPQVSVISILSLLLIESSIQKLLAVTKAHGSKIQTRHVETVIAMTVSSEYRTHTHTPLLNPAASPCVGPLLAAHCKLECCLIGFLGSAMGRLWE